MKFLKIIKTPAPAINPTKAIHDNLDKKMIFSVIQNRLHKNMKLQLDATTIYAITDGNYDLGR